MYDILLYLDSVTRDNRMLQNDFNNQNHFETTY